MSEPPERTGRLAPVTRGRDHRIDLLRGLAILSVLLLHFDLSYRLTQNFSGLAGQLFRTAIRNGNYGVVLFFVISGYLITSTSLRRFGSLAQVSPRVFYAFRAARILPCLLLALAIITPLGLAGIPSFRDNRHVPFWLADLSVLTFWHNVLMARFGYFNYCLNIYWSLSVEEVFYLAFPLICLLKKPRWIASLWLLAIAMGPVYRYLHADNDILFLYGNVACFDALAMGCLTAILARSARMTARARDIVQMFALVFIAMVYSRGSVGEAPVWGPELIAIAAAAFLFSEGAASCEYSQARQRFRVFAWMGRHSYELYLFHIVILAAMRDLIKPAGLVITAKFALLLLFLSLSLACSAAIARFYSEPLNKKLRQRLIASSKFAIPKSL